MANFVLFPDLVAKMIFKLLPKTEKLTLSIERTNWKFGQTNINIFMLGVVYDGVAFPLLFKMLDKRGNSKSEERIDLIERFIDLFQTDNIDAIVADREFVGKEWIAYLNRKKINYFIRIQNNFKVKLSNNKEVKVWHLFNRYQKMNLYISQNRCLFKMNIVIYQVVESTSLMGKKNFLF